MNQKDPYFHSLLLDSAGAAVQTMRLGYLVQLVMAQSARAQQPRRLLFFPLPSWSGFLLLFLAHRLHSPFVRKTHRFVIQCRHQARLKGENIFSNAALVVPTSLRPMLFFLFPRNSFIERSRCCCRICSYRENFAGVETSRMKSTRTKRQQKKKKEKERKGSTKTREA